MSINYKAGRPESGSSFWHREN